MNVYDSDYIEADSCPMGTLQGRVLDSLVSAVTFKKEVLITYRERLEEGYGGCRED